MVVVHASGSDGNTSEDVGGVVGGALGGLGVNLSKVDGGDVEGLAQEMAVDGDVVVYVVDGVLGGGSVLSNLPLNEKLVLGQELVVELLTSSGVLLKGVLPGEPDLLVDGSALLSPGSDLIAVEGKGDLGHSEGLVKLITFPVTFPVFPITFPHGNIIRIGHVPLDCGFIIRIGHVPVVRRSCSLPIVHINRPRDLGLKTLEVEHSVDGISIGVVVVLEPLSHLGEGLSEGSAADEDVVGGVLSDVTDDLSANSNLLVMGRSELTMESLGSISDRINEVPGGPTDIRVDLVEFISDQFRFGLDPGLVDVDGETKAAGLRNLVDDSRVNVLGGGFLHGGGSFGGLSLPGFSDFGGLSHPGGSDFGGLSLPGSSGSSGIPGSGSSGLPDSDSSFSSGSDGSNSSGSENELVHLNS